MCTQHILCDGCQLICQHCYMRLIGSRTCSVYMSHRLQPISSIHLCNISCPSVQIQDLLATVKTLHVKVVLYNTGVQHKTQHPLSSGQAKLSDVYHLHDIHICIMHNWSATTSIDCCLNTLLPVYLMSSETAASILTGRWLGELSILAAAVSLSSDVLSGLSEPLTGLDSYEGFSANLAWG